MVFLVKVTTILFSMTKIYLSGKFKSLRAILLVFW